jgi:hypothetical protein
MFRTKAALRADGTLEASRRLTVYVDVGGLMRRLVAAALAVIMLLTACEWREGSPAQPEQTNSTTHRGA